MSHTGSIMRGSTSASTIRLFPYEHVDSNMFANLDRELNVWLISLPQCCQLYNPDPNDMESGRRSVVVQRMLLHMVYFTAIIALHRPCSIYALSNIECTADPSRISSS